MKAAAVLRWWPHANHLSHMALVRLKYGTLATMMLPSVWFSSLKLGLQNHHDTTPDACSLRWLRSKLKFPDDFSVWPEIWNTIGIACLVLPQYLNESWPFHRFYALFNDLLRCRFLGYSTNRFHLDICTLFITKNGSQTKSCSLFASMNFDDWFHGIVVLHVTKQTRSLLQAVATFLLPQTSVSSSQIRLQIAINMSEQDNHPRHQPSGSTSSEPLKLEKSGMSILTWIATVTRHNKIV